jgi:hypothetical protein
VLEIVDARGRLEGYNGCMRIVEWNEPAEVGACSWTCPRHGTWGIRDDGTEFGPRTKIERLVALGPEPRPPLLERVRRAMRSSS